MDTVQGFDPFFDGGSRVLILGSFPSVKSREQNFYYSNPRNAFWRILSSFFGECEPQTVGQKKEFLSRHNIALWDIVAECEITASRDETIKNFRTADVGYLLQKVPIKFILINGGRAYEIFVKAYGGISVPYIKLPSTSPANTRSKDEEWYAALRKAFDRA